MTIRPATVEDVPRVLEMAKRFLVLTDYGKIIATMPDRLDSLIRTVLEVGVILVVDVGEATVAMLGLVPLNDPFSGELIVAELAWWVEPEHRQGSIGPRLLCAGEDWTRHIGAGVLKMVAPIGSGVGTFYERHGYIAIETSYHKDLRG